MSISIQFQYQPDPTRRPHDEADHNDPIEIEDGQVALIPNVGDTVNYGSYEYDYEPDGKLIEDSGREITVARKVITRHFGYHGGKLIFVNIVVGDVPKGEMGMRLKE
jgi:hypothetical protein